jgi:hypothetical protein
MATRKPKFPLARNRDLDPQPAWRGKPVEPGMQLRPSSCKYMICEE